MSWMPSENDGLDYGLPVLLIISGAGVDGDFFWAMDGRRRGQLMKKFTGSQGITRGTSARANMMAPGKVSEKTRAYLEEAERLRQSREREEVYGKTTGEGIGGALYDFGLGPLPVMELVRFRSDGPPVNTAAPPPKKRFSNGSSRAVVEVRRRKIAS